MPNVSERDKKFLIGGGICVIIYCLIVFAAEPLYKKQQRMERQIETKIGFVEKYYEILNSLSYYNQKKKSNEKLRTRLGKLFLKETKPALAAASLQKMLETHAGNASVAIVSAKTEKPKYIESLQAVPVEITVRTTLKNLSRFLFLIENSDQFLRVENISIKRIGKNDSPEKLTAKILVDGFIQKLEPEKPKKA